MKRISLFILLATGSFLFNACKKTSGTGPDPGNTALSYGDSVFYLNNSTADYIIHPLTAGTGKYYGFPDGINLDENTGAIDVTKSETGLRYRISFVAAGQSDSVQTDIIISGINFLDGFYLLTGNDSIAHPVYNARLANTLPGVNNGSLFDEGSNCNSNGCTVSTADGEINLAETVRNGVFGATPSNNARQEFQMNYRINDKSGKASNTLRIKLYYFDTMSDVTQEAYDIIASRDGTIFDLSDYHLAYQASVQTDAVHTTTSVNQVNKAAKPRPPCIFIVGR